MIVHVALAGDGRTFLKTGYIIPSLSTMNSNFHRISLIRILLPVNGEHYKEIAVNLPQR
jgi:hypothetical protein